MKTVIIDLGNYNIKYLGDNMGLFSSKYHTNFEPNADAFNRITVDNKTFFIGVGNYSLEYTKINKDSLIPQVLYAINKAIEGNNITTNLCLLLPIEQTPQKEKLQDIFNKRFFNVYINGKTTNIRIEKCLVLPECQTARYSCSYNSEDLLLIDIGSRTTNFAAYNVEGLVVNGTARIGVIDLYHRIMQIENSKGNDYVLEDIETQIKRGKIIVDNNIILDFFKQVINSIKTKVNITNYDVVFTGGGALVLQSVINSIEGVEIHDNPVYSSVLGAKVVCEELLS